MFAFNFLSKSIFKKDPVIVLPYGGFISNTRIVAHARILEDEGIEHSENDGFFKNLYNSYKRFETDEIENAKVIVSWGDEERVLRSDHEGYILIDEKHQMDIEDSDVLWFPITYRLIVKDEEIYSVTDELMRPCRQSSFGIISDLDDTVIQTGVSSTLKWRLIVNSFFKHSSQRIPLEGADEFYQLLAEGADGERENPFFYLSNSPWNLYEYLDSFLDQYDFPKGSLLLRDIGISNKKKPSFLEENKFVRISQILSMYPKRSFILIGDAADIDAEIYTEVARQFPEQVAAIYIRVIEHKRKMRKLTQFIKETTDVDIVLIENSEEGIEHAKKHGFIYTQNSD
jgi:phosphatidate phosphatase APP1